VREELLDAEYLPDDLRLLVDLVGERLQLLGFLVVLFVLCVAVFLLRRRHNVVVIFLFVFVVVIVVVAVVAGGGAAEALVVLRVGLGVV
jgi:hypothetical protein